MVKNDYTVTMPYKDFMGYEKRAEDLIKLKEEIKSCISNTENGIMIDVNKLKRIALDLMPRRYQDVSLIEIR